MSFITDIVISTPGERIATLFQDEVAKYRGYRPERLGHNERPTALFVFQLGINYMEDGLREWIVSQAWPRGTMIFIEGDHDDEPTIITVPGPREYDD